MGLFHRHHHHRGWFARLMLRRIGRKLRLDNGQQARLEALRGKMSEVQEDLRQVRCDTHVEAEKLITAERMDREAARRLLAVPRYAMEERIPEIVDSFADLFDSLNDEQRRRLLELWQRHQRQHGVPA